jgi:CubicO group peptidase (beta-lactamase class C family)
MKTVILIALLLAVAAPWVKAVTAWQRPKDATLSDLLERVRAKYHLPALAGAIVTKDGVVDMAAVGVRKSGATVPVTTNDLWHLGSDTKAMTALLAGTFVAEGKLAWSDKVISFFPEIADKVPAANRDITIAQVLSHQAGLEANLPMWQAVLLAGPIIDQRRAAAEAALLAPTTAPGAFHYSNCDYVVIGAILEKLGGKSWEDLMRVRIFTPLHMNSAGFGGTGTVGQIDQPWPHRADGSPAPSNGPAMDNLPYMAPAGAVHCSMTDWGKFLADQMRGGSGKSALLPASIYTAMQTPATNSDYGFGWIIVPRKWAGGKMLSHAGSNTMNYAACWLGPASGYGVLVCSNQGGDALDQAANEVAEGMLALYAIRPHLVLKR